MNYTGPRRLEVSAEKIINAIKTRPPLYNKSDPNYYTMNRHKGKLWKEVCREVFENWDQLKAHQKVECDYDLRKRWKNLRTAFAREVAIQKKEREGHIRLRKVYAYYDQMSFLINPEIVKATDPESIKDSSSCMEDTDEESSDFRIDIEEERENVIVKPEEIEVEGNYAFQEDAISEEIVRKKGGSFQENVLSALEDLKKGGEDEDKQFMMSLVPSLKKLSAKQKFTAKIAILKVLKDVTFQE